ncbi:hypothetical protein JM18_006916 [Phytophthora kernoviae]|uniref:HSF-type DNA-binding domain-containing protein n=1 Tax=Phytophthora kernoviae TaxID=325452 RepID=A0A921SES3_9STRA|nr:hypothetical protein JM18_006916 [Phytophthora kernoviae]
MTAAATGAASKAKATTSTTAEGKHVMLPAFLSKTFEIFSMPEFSSICGWNANGDTIIVSQLETFVSMVLPRFFKHRNFPSFVRQLNLYGFHKTVLDSKRLEFQHPYFKRGRPDLLHHIKRKVSSNNHQQQQLVSTSIQNSRLDAHREISDTLLREMKELRQRSDAMEKRLREVEIDNAIVRSDNLKLWKHLESAKDKQLVMQEKMKKIMWILFQIYRGKQQKLPKLSSNDATGAVISEDYVNSSMLGPKEFHDVLRFLAMDEPPMLPGSSSNNAAAQAPTSRKRKFVEVPADAGDMFTTEAIPYKIDDEPSAVVEMPTTVEDPNQFAMTVPSNPPPMVRPDDTQNNILSIFSPIKSGQATVPNANLPSMESATLGGFLTNGVASPPNTEIDENITGVNASNGTATVPGTAPESSNQLAFLDEDLPLLPDSEHYNFNEGEQQTVMKKLEDFETSLLDEYDVSCLDTLLQVAWTEASYHLDTVVCWALATPKKKHATMDARCIKFWEDGQALVAATSDSSRIEQTQGKIFKELRTMSRLLQRNQSQRFSDAAQQKLVDCVGHYVGLGKQTGVMLPVAEATFQVVKDGLAMPFNVVGTKQKKRLLKWYNELITIVGGDQETLAENGEAQVISNIEWSVMDIDEDGYLSLMQPETGDTNESFQVKKKSAEFKRIKKAFEEQEVTVVTSGDDIVDIRVEDQ